jgi:hypothetical protein
MAASNLFWDCHFVGCPRNTTRSPPIGGSLKQYCLLKAIRFAASKMSLFFQKRFGGIARLTAIRFLFATQYDVSLKQELFKTIEN